MKTTIRNTIGGMALVPALILTLQPTTARAQGTAFTYQGRLEAGGTPYTGLAEMQFSLWDAASGGSQLGTTLTVSPVGVSNGLFTVSLDFGTGVFTGPARWLEIGVRTNLLGFTTLSPRQPVTATPYAVLAGNVSGVIANSSLPANPSFSGTVSGGSFAGSGAGLTGLNASQLTSGTVPDGRLGANVARTNQVWLLGGNAGTTPGTHFLGTTDNQPLELRVNGQRALRIEPDADSPNLVGGSASNSVAPGLKGVTIAGGGLPLYPNRITNHYAAIGGGMHNLAGGAWATIAGGRDNLATGRHSTVGGGSGNIASGSAATVSGGDFNSASNSYSTVGGGVGNIASGSMATVGGGSVNTASGSNATVPGGRENRADGLYSLAAGRQARALHDGSFVWADSQEADFASTGDNQFNVRAAGGARFETGGAGLTVDGQPVLRGPAPGQPLVLSVDGQPGLRIEPNANNAPNVIGGYAGNYVSNTVVGATIGGGGAGFYANQVLWHFGTVGGGRANTASGLSATVGGGRGNTASGSAATVSGGEFNTASGEFATVGGGWYNEALGGSATISGGQLNFASGDGATIPGGHRNVATAFAFAAGRRAKAIHTGAFVWADSQDADFASTADNQFNIRAAGGVRLNNDTTLSFGNQTRQMINLWNAEYGIGVQSDTTYFRSGNDFAWFKGGSHSDTAGNAGAGGSALMFLSRFGNLGLGTSSPGAHLDVVAGQGLGRFTSTNSANGAVLILRNTSDSPGYLGAINFETAAATPGQIGYFASGQMSFRAGGVERMTLNASGLTVNGTFVSSSDRNAKENFEPVNPQEVLEKVAALPVSQWNYKDDAGARHIGPMAQDFHAAFGVGPDDKHIATVDADGVALAAIQGLNRKVEDRSQKSEARIDKLEAELRRRDAENAGLRAELAELKQLVRTLAAEGKAGAR